jgi:hypothetical protein
VYLRIGMYFLVRTIGNPLDLVPAVKRAVLDVELEDYRRVTKAIGQADRKGLARRRLRPPSMLRLAGLWTLGLGLWTDHACHADKPRAWSP